MADPFLYIDLLSKGTDLINTYSETIGGIIANLDIGDGEQVLSKSIPGGAAYLGLEWGGSIADLNLTLSEGSGAKFKSFDSIGDGVEGQFWYPANINIKGLDSIVKDGFDTIAPDSLDTSTDTTQVLSLALESEGQVEAPFNVDFNVEYLTIKAAGLVIENVSQDFPMSDELVGDPEKVTTTLNVPIQYDRKSRLVSIGDYDFSDFDFNPNLSMVWSAIYDEAFKPIADWWDGIFKSLGADVPNPISKMNDNVINQLDSGDNFSKKAVANLLDDQINDSSVKPYVDASILPLLKYSWNQEDYPARFVDVSESYRTVDDMLSASEAKIRNSSIDHVYDGVGRQKLEAPGRQDLEALGKSKSTRFTFFSGDSFKRKNADIITNFSSSRGDNIALSAMKFECLDEISFETVSSRKELRRAKKNNSNIIAFDRGGKRGVELFYDDNCREGGLGDGGIFAIVKDGSGDSPLISAQDFILI